ncbi:MAG: hypothetical protein LRY56_08680 [Burkholderiaceae bacterium]|nr:hypothetical protein [Burkholderiaceae bacterium]MCD8537544.1 hypothetical protein [Burkholderiaceae bacterium]
MKRNSYVACQKACLEGADKLLRGVQSGELVAHMRMDGAVFARVCKGLEESRLTPAELLVFYRNATATGQTEVTDAKHRYLTPGESHTKAVWCRPS